MLLRALALLFLLAACSPGPAPFTGPMVIGDTAPV